ncbi:exosortase-associated protein EpsI, V-type [Glacieibacterium megasporae]|uniref:exosortase-associated protein EpsI, V-type n=1 Tax=Glacieibacterium megasporae TaxID=2835787 RepID=UPI001C1DD89F|nr:exosortase-associated protein EpsI, V-type [Polymorphobacter megasporae]UAJ09335.1 EpsI family protein [Polymorphobacter megasporae]
MIDRRDILLGGGMLLAAAGAAALTPRHHVELLHGRKLDSIIPESFGAWRMTPSSAFVLPKTPGSLADRLYSDTVTRLYVAPNQLPIMMVLAYGNLQSDLLQLHRPETCYAAVGFQISNSTRTALPVAPKVAIPLRELTASTENRVEPIAYWTRIGDYLPTDKHEQRTMRFREQLAGIIPDGILVRLSTVAEPTPETFKALTEFGRALVLGVKPADRAILIGPTLAAELSRLGV